MHVIVDSLMTSYDMVGKGPVVLMLHGWGDDKRTFKPIMRSLQNNFTVISLDLPGFGEAQAPKEPWGLSDYGGFVAHFIKKVNVGQIYATVGHSNGGAIAIRGLAEEKFSSKRLVLLASAGVRSTYKGRKKILRVAAQAAKAATYPLPKKMQTRLKKGAYKAVGSDLFVAEHLQETFKKVVTDDVQQDAASLQIPTLLLYGADDTATPPEYGKLLAGKIPNSNLHVIAHAGHFVHIDQPEETTTLLKDFLQK